jgi:diaminohydroxyphosphoribosylaminopyrimidine deaminase/5-amino-6-(5-phosphoribosylamino)uracil reductase
VARVVIGCRDPHPQAGGGIGTLQAAGIAVTVGVESAACWQLAEVFLTGQTLRRPWLQLKLATTLDGRVAAADGSSRWISGPEARRQVHVWRAEADAVLVGSGTALADDPLLDVRDLHDPRAQRPLRVVADRRGRLHRALRLCDIASQPTRIYTVAGAPHPLQGWGPEVRYLTDGTDWLQRLLSDLYSSGVHHLLCEGGATLATALLREGLVDRLDWVVAPKLIGSGRLATGDLGLTTIAAAQAWQFAAPRRAGEDIWLTARPVREGAACSQG